MNFGTFGESDRPNMSDAPSPRTAFGASSSLKRRGRSPSSIHSCCHWPSRISPGPPGKRRRRGGVRRRSPPRVRADGGVDVVVRDWGGGLGALKPPVRAFSSARPDHIATGVLSAERIARLHAGGEFLTSARNDEHENRKETRGLGQGSSNSGLPGESRQPVWNLRARSPVELLYEMNICGRRRFATAHVRPPQSGERDAVSALGLIVRGLEQPSRRWVREATTGRRPHSRL